MRLRQLIAIVHFCSASILFAQNDSVYIHGNASEYAGHHLVLETLINPISMEMQELFVIPVDDKGDFAQSFELNEIVYASLDMGRYRGNIYLEPGMKYQLVLPPFEPRTDAERFNPYFIPEDVVLGIANEEAQKLNQTIIRFDDALKTFYNDNAVKIFSRGDAKKAASIIHQLDSLYPTTDNSYFKLYKQYAYGELKSLAYKRQKRRVMKEVFTPDSLNINMPSFHVAFNTIYKSFFTSYFSSSKGKALRDAYNQRASFDSLSLVIQNDDLFANAEFAEVVLLKGLYDAYYSGRYDELRIINLYKQAETVGNTQLVRELAIGLHRKVNKLRAGSKAPTFTLFRLDGKEKSLEDYKRRFVYLSFIHTENHACKQDLELLNVISKRMKRDVTLLTIILDEDPSRAKAMIKEKKYKWDFLHYALMPQVVLDYDIKALPVYYVIDPDGNLRLTPAPAPGENFGPVFQEAVRKYNYDQLRKNRPKEKSIYDF